METNDRLKRVLRRVRVALLSGCVMAAGMGLGTGCAPSARNDGVMGSGDGVRGLSSTPPEVGVAPMAMGIFTPLPAGAMHLEGDALKKSKMTLAEAIADARIVSVVTTPASAASTAPVAGEAPSQAVKLYLQARAKYAENARSEAMELLRKANQLDPKSFTILRLMGEVCFQSSQLSTGSMYLKEAHQLQPADMEVSYLLGRYFVDLKEWPTAISLMAAADLSPERKPGSAIEARVIFNLGLSLHSGGYHTAAAAVLERYLTLTRTPTVAYKYDRDLEYIKQEAWAVHLMVAEDYAVIGEMDKALPHYRAASTGVAKRPIDISGKAYVLSREIIALARIKKAPDQLIQSALKLVGATKGSEQSIELLGWVARQLGREDEAMALLEKAAQDNTDRGMSALALAGVQERFGHKDKALATLEKYFSEHPTDVGVLERLVKLSTSLKRPGAAFAALARGLDADPAKADDIRKHLFTLVGDHPTMDETRGFEKAIPEGAAGVTGKGKYLLALMADAADDRIASLDYLAVAVKLDPLFWPAREAYLSVLLATDQFTVATRIVQEAIDSKQGGEKARRLQIESEAMQGRWSSALKLAQKAAADYPDSSDIALQVAQIHMARYERKLAADQLKVILKRFPKFEDGYKSTIELAIAMRDGDTMFNALKDLMVELPNSRYGTLMLAGLYSREGRSDDSEMMLRRLLAEKPGDVDALVSLAQILKDQEKSTDAVKLLEGALKSHPSPMLADGLASLLRELNRKADALALTSWLMEEHKDSEAWLLLHVSELIAQEKKDEAEALLRKAADKFPRSPDTTIRLCRYLSGAGKPQEAIDALLKFNAANGGTAERYYLLGHFYNEVGDDDKSTASLEKVLEINPDHTGACNDLGYFWVDKGRNLPRAEFLIRKAVENQPLNPAFVDSLGWVLYKQGKFAPAVEQLEKAVGLPGGDEAEVVSHLGDALFRMGQKDRALRYWRMAARMLEQGKTAPDKDKMLAQLKKQIRQAERNESVDTAPLAPPEKGTSADGTK